jgi:hypothetical protein
MKTHSDVIIYKLTNDIDDKCFYGHTTTPISSRFASLKRESANARYNGPMHNHIRKLGREHFKMSFVKRFEDVTLDEAKAHIADLEKDLSDQQTEQEPEPQAEQQETEQQTEQTGCKTEAQYLSYVDDIIQFDVFDNIYTYLEDKHFDQLDFIRKFNLIERALLGHPDPYATKTKYTAVVQAVAKLRDFLSTSYSLLALDKTCLTRRDKKLHSALELLTKPIDVATDVTTERK